MLKPSLRNTWLRQRQFCCDEDSRLLKFACLHKLVRRSDENPHHAVARRDQDQLVRCNTRQWRAHRPAPGAWE